MQVTINLPEDVAQVFLKNGENIEREVLKAVAIKFYRNEKLSHAQVGRMLGYNLSETDAFLKSRNVPLNYSIEDLEQDRRTLDKLLSK